MRSLLYKVEVIRVVENQDNTLAVAECFEQVARLYLEAGNEYTEFAVFYSKRGVDVRFATYGNENKTSV